MSSRYRNDELVHPVEARADVCHNPAAANAQECEVCDGIGCPCQRMRDWQSMEYGCKCGCLACSRHPLIATEPPLEETSD